jgi:2-oxoisovalerate ferredoxin oxidoreductase beta subunit
MHGQPHRPLARKVKGQPVWKKNMPEIVAAHRIPYVATCSIAFPIDFIQKLKKAKEANGPSYIHLLAPCPLGWRHPSSITIKIARLAVETCVFPLYEIENGRYKINYYPPEILPLKEYLKLQGRFNHLTDEDIQEMEKMVREEWELLKKKAEFFKQEG